MGAELRLNPLFLRLEDVESIYTWICVESVPTRLGMGSDRVFFYC